MGVPNASQLHYVEVMCEAFLHGMFTILIAVIIWLLRRPGPRMPKIHKILFMAGIVMWILATVHLGLVIQQVTTVVTPIRNVEAQVSIGTLQYMIGDIILIWRVWAVWGRNYWMTIIPFLLMVIPVGLGFTQAAQITTFAARGHLADVASALIVTNVLLSTILIAGRIWYLQWQTNRLMSRSALKLGTSNRYKGTLLLIIESGALYGITQLLDLILDDLHNPGVHTVLDMQIPIAGILPTLIVLVVHFELVPVAPTEKYNAAVITSRFQAASRHEMGLPDTRSTTVGSTNDPDMSTPNLSETAVHLKEKEDV